MLYEWLQILHRAKGGFAIPERDNHLEQIRLVLRDAPKLRVLLATVAEETVQNEGKDCILVYSSFSSDLLFVTLT